MRTETAPKAYRIHFDSLGELQRWIEETPKTWRYDASKSNPAEQSWDLNVGYEGALKLARDGWHDGAKDMARALLTLPPLDGLPAWKHDVAGYSVDVDRWLTGEPECMWSMSDDAETNRKPILTLGVSIAANCMTGAQPMANYGLAIARYVDQLEAKGQQVEVIAVIADEVHSTRCGISWTVKEAGEALDLAALAFSIGHPASWRRLGFAVLERLPVKAQSNYGYSKDSLLSDMIDPSAGTIILNGMMRANSIAATPEKALEHVGKQIETAMSNFEAATVD